MASDDEDVTGPLVGQGSTSAATKEPDEDDFFRTKTSFVEKMRAKRLEAQEKKKREERRRSEESVSVERADPAIHENKRRKVSKDTEDEDDSDRARRTKTPSFITRDRNSRSESAKRPRESPNTLSKKYSQLTGSQSKVHRSQSANILTLSDSDDNNFLGDDRRADFPGSRHKPIDDDLSASEDEAELARLAAARDKFLAKMNKPLPPAGPSQEEIKMKKIAERLEQFRRTGSMAKSNSDVSIAPPIPAAQFDPKIKILITSKLEGTKELIIIVKASMRLKDARLMWCDRQEIPFTESQRDSIFLTWKGNRVWDATTCKRMLNIQGNEIKMSGEGFKEDQLHMVAWTPETFEQYKREEQLSRPNFPGEEQKEESEEEAAPKERKIKINLIAKDIEVFKLIVRDSTRIAKIMSSFQTERGIAAEKEVILRFDGEALDPEDCVKDIDLEDHDVIEVQIK